MNDSQSQRVVCEGWDEVAKSIEQSSAWIKLEPGQSVQLNFVAKPKEIEKEYPKPEGGIEVRKKISVQVYVPGQGLRTWEAGKMVWKDVEEERQDRGGQFADALFTLKRDGAGMSTKWKIRYARQLSSAELDERRQLVGGGNNSADIPF